MSLHLQVAKVAKRVLRYLQGTITKVFTSLMKTLLVFCDADWAGDRIDYKSIRLPTSSILALTQFHGIPKSKTLLINLQQKLNIEPLHQLLMKLFGYKSYS